jgi:NAD(P)-dependent dehydrogenase (short-subunit alcohol dehydrogenase family)
MYRPQVIFPDLAHKVAVVTGSSVGIGQAICTYLLNQARSACVLQALFISSGVQSCLRVYGLDKNPPIKTVLGLTHIQTDITDAKSVTTAVDKITRLHPAIDYLVSRFLVSQLYAIVQLWGVGELCGGRSKIFPC